MKKNGTTTDTAPAIMKPHTTMTTPYPKLYALTKSVTEDNENDVRYACGNECSGGFLKVCA